MLDDSNEDAQRQFRRQVDDDVANWISQLDSDTGSGVPPPPQIKVTEVSSEPYEFHTPVRGEQGGETAPAPGSQPSPAPIGICCTDSICSITTEADCEGLWFETNATCDDVMCCHPYFEVHVQLTVTEGACGQVIDLTAILERDTVEAPDGCCTDQITGNFSATDDDGNEISGSITSSSGGMLSWFVNITPNCVTHHGCGFTSDTVTGDCTDGGTAHYDVNDVTADCSAVGTIDITWHG